MVWTIPNTFVAGTKARANEVNENFTSLKQFVDTLEVQASTNEINITNLENNKANINGDNQQRFQVADPTSSLDAVNLRTLENKTLNSRSVIDGFDLSKFNDTTITATAGNCYDSTFVYMISSSTSIQKSQTGLGNNATYYVYACAQESSGTVELVFNVSPTTPELPSGFDYFRCLGYFTTNDNGNIDKVFKDGIQPITTDESLNETGYVVLTNGLIIQWGVTNVPGTNTSATVTLPISFTTTFFNINCSPAYVVASDNWDRGIAGAYINSLSSFTIVRGRGMSENSNVYWIAIGI